MQIDILGRGTLGSLPLVRQASSCSGQQDALYSSTETLVPLGVVVLETNLEFNGLDKVAFLLAIGFSEQFLDGAPHA